MGEPVYPALPARVADFDVSYTYGAGGRAIKTVKDAAGVERHTVDVFGTLRLAGAQYDAGGNDYERTADTEKVFLAGLGRVVYDGAHALPSPSQSDLHVFLAIGDHQGSTSVVIDMETSEVVEKATYLAFGAPDSDFRPERWGAHREDNRYTGKEDDIEVGLTYFGARYYSPYLHTWTQADPLTIQALGSDLNPYAFVNGNPASYTDPTGLDGCMDNLNRGCGGGGGGGGGPVSVNPPRGGSWDDALNGVCRLLGGCGANRRSAGGGGGGSSEPPKKQADPPPARTAPGAAGTFIAPAVAHSPLAATVALNVGKMLTSDVGAARGMALQLLENRTPANAARLGGGYTAGFGLGAASGAARMAAGDGVAGLAFSTVFNAALSHVPGAHGNLGFQLGMIQGGRVPGAFAAAAGGYFLPFGAPASQAAAAEGSAAAGDTATVLLHDTGHTSILTDVGGEVLHTHQVQIMGGRLTTIAEVVPAEAPPVINSATVPLPSGAAAAAYQRGMVGTPTGPYHILGNNCFGHCANVLRAGGVQGVPMNSTLLVPWLLGGNR